MNEKLRESWKQSGYLDNLKPSILPESFSKLLEAELIQVVKDSKEFATHEIDLPDLTEEEKEIYNQKFFGKYLKEEK